MSAAPSTNSPSHSPSAPAGAATRLTRDDLLRLGQAGRPWEFVPLALKALRIAPHDAGMRFLLAVNYARLRLRTPAREQLALLPDAAAADPNVQALAGVLAQLPDDRVSPEERVATCRANVAALAARGVDLSPALGRWEPGVAAEDAFRAGDGNIVRRRAGNVDGGGGWIRFADDLSAGAALELPAGEGGTQAPGGRDGAGAASGAGMAKPHVLEGMDPPWIFKRLVEATPRRPDGYLPRITLVQADEREFLDGLSLADLRGELAQERVVVIVGADAGERLAADLAGRMGVQIYGPTIVAPGVRTPVVAPGGSGGTERIVEAAARRQGEIEARLLSEVAQLHAGHDRAWWARRYDEALRGGGAPLRVLIPTCRYSTFVQHSARDLAGALERAGCRVEVLIEPDDSSLLSSVGYLEAAARFRPDLIVAINYTRANLGESLCPGVPYACWIQDAMPHLFDAAVGRAQGDLDFLAGHLHPALFERFGFARSRAIETPVLACDRKFHSAPVAPDLRERFACEIAYVGHQSETPGDLWERLMRTATAGQTGGSAATLRRALDGVLPRIRAIADDPMAHRPHAELEAAARTSLQEALGAEPPAGLVSIMMNQFCLPIADRLVRHRSLEWAAEAAEANGWRLRLYGRGWERHPRLGGYAAGEVAHGEALRACYQSAAVHLHTSINSLMHQRVLECALSGGLPLCRLQRDDLALVEVWATASAADLAEPELCTLADRLHHWRIADVPPLMRLAAQFQRLGLPAHMTYPALTPLIDAARRTDPEVLARHPGWLLWDLAETTFTSAPTLEAALRRAIEDPAWRSAASGAIAARVREGLTYGVFARRLIDRVGASLAEGAPADSGARTAVQSPAGAGIVKSAVA